MASAFYLSFDDYPTAFLFAEICAILSCLFIFIMNARAYFKFVEYRPFLRLIIIGLSFFCSGVIIYLLSQNEVLPSNFVTDNIIVIGAAIEVCFFNGSLSLYQNSLSKKYHELLAVQNEKLQDGIMERTKELQQKNVDLINSLEEKENLMSIVAHDLKSPLNQTKALSNLITKVVHDPTEVQELLTRIQTANDRGLQLIHELNTITNLEADSSWMNFEKINVVDGLEPVLEKFAAIAERKSIVLQIDGCENCMLSTHPPYLIRIIENLLSNAMKFSAAGSTVQFIVRRQDTLEILVCDQGPGFSKEDLKKVFRNSKGFQHFRPLERIQQALGCKLLNYWQKEYRLSCRLRANLAREVHFRLSSMNSFF